MAPAELIVDVHHHYMPAKLFDRLAAQAGGRRIVTNEISLTLNPSRKDLEAHLKVMDEAGVTVSILTDQVQVMGADVAKLLNDGIADVEKKHPTRFPGLRFVMPHLGGAVSSLKGRMMAFFETEDASIPAEMKGYLKTQSEQKRFGLTEQFERLFQSLYFDTAGTGAWHPAMTAAF